MSGPVKISIERKKELECAEFEELTAEELNAGYHFCPDWDYAVIGPDDPEKQGCTCVDYRKWP